MVFNHVDAPIGLETANERNRMVGAFAQMQEQLGYLLQNIDADNLGKALTAKMKEQDERIAALHRTSKEQRELSAKLAKNTAVGDMECVTNMEIEAMMSS